MLTRENFKDTWARPKPEEKKMGVKGNGEEMAVDVPPIKGSTRELGNISDHENGEAAKSSVEEGTMEAQKDSSNAKSKDWPSKSLQVFAFQRHGIGAIKNKFPHPRRNPKK